jgi:hypothetical protein
MQIELSTTFWTYSPLRMLTTSDIQASEEKRTDHMRIFSLWMFFESRRSTKIQEDVHRLMPHYPLALWPCHFLSGASSTIANVKKLWNNQDCFYFRLLLPFSPGKQFGA